MLELNILSVVCAALVVSGNAASDTRVGSGSKSFSWPIDAARGADSIWIRQSECQ